MLFLAQLLNRPVFAADGVNLGWVEDLVLTGLDLFPTVAALVLARRGHGAVFLPWEQVKSINHAGLHLHATREQLHTSPLDDTAIFLRRDILDKQIIDIHGRKVVRVNDLQLAPIDHELRLIGADIGARGLLRRLNLEGVVQVIASAVKSPLPERIIPWNYVEGLEMEWPAVRLNVSHRRLRDLPPPDLADILAQLHPVDRQEMVSHIDDETLADTLPHLEDDVQAAVLLAMTDERASDILEILPPDEAADVLGELSEERAEHLLHLMEPEDAEDVRELLRYDDDTAGGRMTTEFLALREGMTVAEALEELRRQAPHAETIYYIYVVDKQEHLLGVVSLRDLITADQGTRVAALSRQDVIRVLVTDDQETVAHRLNHYHLLAVPVVDAEDMLLGIVTVDDVLDVMREEAEEDLSRQAGTVEEADVLATPWEQAVLRLPWMLGAAATGLLSAAFLDWRLAAVPTSQAALLVLLPLLILLGVQIGAQGAATAQAELSEGGEIADIVQGLSRQQWPTGIGLGALGALVGGVITVWMGAAPWHALAVGGMLWFVLVLDMLLGSLLPLLLHRLRWDPVLISRPALAVMAMLVGVPLLAQVL